MIQQKQQRDFSSFDNLYSLSVSPYKPMLPKLLRLLIFAANLLFCLGAANAQPQPSPPLIVQPMMVSLKVAPGELAKTALTLEHSGKDVVQVKVETCDLAKDKEGSWALVDTRNQDADDLTMTESCRHWISLKESETDIIDLEPESTTSLDLEIRIPSTAKGTYWAAIKIKFTNTVNTGVRITYAFVVPVILEIAKSGSFLDCEAILAGWKSTYGSIRTLRTVHSMELIDKPASGQLPDYVEKEYLEIVDDGDRFCKQFAQTEDDFLASGRSYLYSFDGELSQAYLAPINRGKVRKGLYGWAASASAESGRYVLSCMLMRDVELSEKQREKYSRRTMPYFEHLLTGRWTKSVEPELDFVNGEPCHVISLSDVDGSKSHKIWVAHEKGMCPVKWVRYSSDRIGTQVEFQELAVASSPTGDIWYPTVTERRIRVEEGMLTQKLSIKVFEPNIQTDKDMFRFKFPIGTRVTDHVANTTYVAGRTAKK
jgi:hypothetical protein